MVSAPGPSFYGLGCRVLLGQRLCRLEAPRPTPEDLERLVRKVVGRRAWFLRAFPSILALLGDCVLRSGVELSRYPKGIISRGETLTAVRRATIEGAFRGPVVDHYACNEMAHVAQSCPAGSTGLHVLGDRVIVHVVREDGRPATPGERGRVLLTDLENQVMPFINYEVGDLATVGSPCACGRASRCSPRSTAESTRLSGCLRVTGSPRSLWKRISTRSVTSGCSASTRSGRRRPTASSSGW